MVLSNQTGRLAPQSMLRERYMILGLAGRGGMGSVYKATDTLEHDRKVAIKEMSQAHLGPEKLTEAQERFRQEAAMLGQLAHPHLPRVLDSFTESGRSYLVMDFIDGKTLFQLITEQTNQQLPVEQVLHYAIQLCTVLDYLHQQSPPIIFRDLKPSNVMVTSQGEVFLIDFGIARHFTQGKLQDTIPLGSEGFCPPEQFGTGQTSPRSDLYSLGATLYYALTGKNPRSNKPTLFDFTPITELNPQVPADLNKLILWLLATREEQRPESASQVRQLLQALEQWSSASTTQTRKSKSKTLQLIRMHSGHFYDTRTARAAQARQWLTTCNPLPNPLGHWTSQALIPFLALLLAQIETWTLLLALPILHHLQETSNAFFRRISQNEEYSFFPERFLTSSIWTPYFTLLFFLLPLLLGTTSLYFLHVLHISPLFLALFLTLFLLLSTLKSSTNPHLHHQRQILLALLPIFLITTLILLSQPAVLSSLRQLTPNQLICSALPALALFSFLRPRTRFAWIDHLSMTLTISIYALLQYAFGTQVLLRFGPMAQTLNHILVGILGGIALTTILRIRQPFTWGERFLLCLVACIVPALQYTFGLQEIAHAPLILSLLQATPLDPLDLVSLNILLVIGPPLLTLLWLFLPPARRSSRLARFPLLPLAFTAAGLQNVLGPQLSTITGMSNPLTLSIGTLFTPAQYLSLALLVLIPLLSGRQSQRLRRLKHGAIFVISLTCALLQSTAWNKTIHLSTRPGQTPALLSSSIAALNQPQFYTAACNKLLAEGLMLVVLCSLALFLFLLSARFLVQFSLFKPLFHHHLRFWSLTMHLLLRLEHTLLLATTITCCLLYWFFGNATPLLRFTPALFSLGQLLLSLLLISSLLILIRITHPIGLLERLVLQLDALACALLLWPSSPSNNAPLHALPTWTLALPFPLLPLSLLLAILLSFLWLKLPIPLRSRQILSALLVAALLCNILQGLAPGLLLLSLLSLIEATLLATQIAIQIILQTTETP